MKSKISILLSIMLIVLLTTTTVYAGGSVKLSGAITKGSLDFSGLMTGLGGYTQGVTVSFTAFGKPLIHCTASDGDSGDIEHSETRLLGELQVPNSTIIVDKGKVPVGVSVDFTVDGLGGSNVLCKTFIDRDPDDTWTAQLVDTTWTRANIDVYNGAGTSGAQLRHQEYTCNTATETKTFVSCPLTLDQSLK
jgi:hypothetical protein